MTEEKKGRGYFINMRSAANQTREVGHGCLFLFPHSVSLRASLCVYLYSFSRKQGRSTDHNSSTKTGRPTKHSACMSLSLSICLSLYVILSYYMLLPLPLLYVYHLRISN